MLVLIIFQKRPPQFDKRVVLDPNFKSPYDLYIAYTQLPLLFNNCSITMNRESPENWYDSDSCADGQTVFFLVTQHFNPNTAELHTLYDFVRQGNDVFISTPFMNDAAMEYFGLGEQAVYNYNIINNYYKDSGTVYLNKPPFAKDTSYLNPGFHFAAHFIDVDSLHYYILGKDESGFPNYIKVSAGKGSFYFHSNPLVFSNYFLLYHDNLSYFQKVVSVIPPGKSKIIWDKYYVYKLDDNEKAQSPSPFHVLFSFPSFMWAFSIGGCLLLLYILLGLKLLQRFIPVIAKPKNETLDFTKTIGRLYFEKSDHTNLAKKMATYLLEHIRNRYLISTTTLNEEFSRNLANKSGYDEEKVKEITGNLVYIQAGHKVTEEQLAAIYQSFSKFYKHTS